MRSLLTLRGICIAATCATMFSGCVSGPVYFQDETSAYEPGTDAWWAEKAQLPVGERRRVKKGKVWPIQPRPDAPKQPFSHIYHAATSWPYPYVCQDRQYVRSLFDQQAANGWAEQATLHEYHFDPDTNQINGPGRSHLSWILNAAPPEYRGVYLYQSTDMRLNQVRMASVQQAVDELSFGEGAPSVEWRRALPASRPASQIKAMQDLEAQALPAPIVGGAGGAGAGAAAGGGGGGGGASPGGP